MKALVPSFHVVESTKTIVECEGVETHETEAVAGSLFARPRHEAHYLRDSKFSLAATLSGSILNTSSHLLLARGKSFRS